MQTRLRLVKVATVLLYFGPLFGGMAGFGWSLALPFVAIFLLWLMMIRPEQFPRSNREWLRLSAIGAGLAQLLSQILLVLVLFGIGRGLGGITGLQPMAHPLVPLSFSLISILLYRVLWKSKEPVQAGAFLDAEMSSTRIGRMFLSSNSEIAPLLALPDDAGEQAAMPIVSQTFEGTAASDRLAEVLKSLNTADRSHAALRRTIVIWGTEPEIVAPAFVPHSVAAAFDVSKESPDLLRLFLPRAIALIAAFPDRAAGFPNPADLQSLAATNLARDPKTDLPSHLRADLCDGLRALAAAIEAAPLAAGTAKQDRGQSAPALASARTA